MKHFLSFFFLFLICHTGTAQNLKHVIINDAPSFNTSPLYIEAKTEIKSFNKVSYSQELKKQNITIHRGITTSATDATAFFSFSPKQLKTTLFEEYYMNYNRLQLQRALPQLPDSQSFYPCVVY